MKYEIIKADLLLLKKRIICLLLSGRYSKIMSDFKYFIILELTN